MRLFFASIASATILCLPALVRAQPASPAPDAPAEGEPAATPTATPPSREQDPQWQHDYTVARGRLLAGDFADAADRFDALARDPHGQPVDRALAASMRDVARSWADRGLALVKRNDLGESTLPARAVNERTTDEIAQLYAGAILYGLGTGLWIDAHTQPTDAAGGILPPLLLAAATTGGVALLDVSHPLHYGVAQSAVSGLYLGLEEGIVLSLWDATKPNSTTWQGSTVADVIWATSTIGLVGGGILGNSLGATPGRASFVGSSGLWAGTLAAFAGAAFTSNSQNQASNAFLAAGVGLNAGIVGGLLAAGPVSPSIARVRFLDIGGLGGGLLFGGLYLAGAGNASNAQAASGVAALGIASGLAVAWYATRGIAPDRPEDRAKPETLTFEPTMTPVKGGATLGVVGSL